MAWGNRPNYQQPLRETPFKGKRFIAIRGTLTRMGFVQVLYVTRFPGLVLTYIGNKVI